MLVDILDDAAPAIVISAEDVPPGDWRVLSPEQLDAAAPMAVVPVHPEDPAYIVYSSGSTGRPKGAVHAHRDMRASVEGYSADVLGLAPGDTCHSVARGFTSLGFGNGFFRPLGRGAHVVHTHVKPNVRTVVHACRDHQVTVLTGVPTFWSQLAEFIARHPDEASALSSVRLGVSSGDSLPATVLRRLREVLPAALAARIGELRTSQLIGLRFAGNGEMAGLVERCLSGELANGEAVKKQIKHWQPDWLRA